MASCRVASAINAFYRQHAFPRPDPESAVNSMAGIDPQACGLLGGEIVYCQLSPLHRITLDDEAKAAANIPQASKYFAWAYPAVDDGAFGAGHSAEHMFLRFGGYVYFSRDCQAVETNSIAPAPCGTLGLMFGRGQELTDLAERTLTLQGRFQEITEEQLRAAGATHFAWIRPGEFGDTTAAADGAFAYKFGAAPAKYFPAVGTPVFTPDMVEEELDDSEAWVVVRLPHPTVERIIMFDRELSFNDNLQQAGMSSLVRVQDHFVLVSRGCTKDPIPYSAWQRESGETGTIADPWIMTLCPGWDLDDRLFGSNVVEKS